MDGAADECRTAQGRLPFPLRHAEFGAPPLHGKQSAYNFVVPLLFHPLLT
jgi:hypothetical protein